MIFELLRPVTTICHDMTNNLITCENIWILYSYVEFLIYVIYIDLMLRAYLFHSWTNWKDISTPILYYKMCKIDIRKLDNSFIDHLTKIINIYWK